MSQIDYSAVYAEYWSQPDRWGSSSFSDVEEVVQPILSSCGGGRILDVGCGMGQLVRTLLRKGVDAYGLDVARNAVDYCNSMVPGRYESGSILHIPYPENFYDTIVTTDLLQRLSESDIPMALSELHRVTRRYIFAILSTAPNRDQALHRTLHDREWWERQFFLSGFRKHPLIQTVVPYASLEQEPDQITLIFEKLPTGVNEHYSIEFLDSQQKPHLDMLRDTGRQSDAHIARYNLACGFVRPGDVVLDVACGLGYGSHIFYQNSQAATVLAVDACEFGIAYAQANFGLGDVVRFQIGDAQNLDFLPDNSIDFITSFGVIEHQSDPAAYLAELKRVLRPSGRLFISASNDWADEPGTGPEPHHFHIYTWQRLQAECRDHFLLEKGFVQTAGGAMKCHNAPRKLQEVPLATTLDQEAEWILLLCMADPLAGLGVTYNETVWDISQSPDFNVSAFARDYLNPWLVKGMIALGMRNLLPENLRHMQERVLQSFPPDSVDYGAALCGKAYSILAGDVPADNIYLNMLEQIKVYSSIKAPTPHQLRWQVSLLFVGADLARTRGDFVEATTLYMACSEIDVMPYSPLLGNRTLDALYWLAMFSLQSGDIASARKHLTRSVSEAQRLASGPWLNISGDTDHPLPFGYAEMAQLMDKASRAAYMLAVMESQQSRPGLFYSEAKGYYERLIYWKDNDRRALQQSADSMINEIDRLTAHTKNLAREVAHQDAHAQVLALEVARQDAHAQELALEVARQDAHAQELALELIRQNSRVKDLEQELDMERSKTIVQRLFGKIMPK